MLAENRAYSGMEVVLLGPYLQGCVGEIQRIFGDGSRGFGAIFGKVMLEENEAYSGMEVVLLEPYLEGVCWRNQEDIR